jgi:hypothetical protein
MRTAQHGLARLMTGDGTAARGCCDMRTGDPVVPVIRRRGSVCRLSGAGQGGRSVAPVWSAMVARVADPGHRVDGFGCLIVARGLHTYNFGRMH